MDLCCCQFWDAHSLQAPFDTPEDAVPTVVKVRGIITDFSGNVEVFRYAFEGTTQQFLAFAVKWGGVDVVDP